MKPQTPPLGSIILSLLNPVINAPRLLRHKIRQLPQWTALSACVALAALLLFSPKANATTYYVSTSGNDGSNGTSTSTPWQTIAKVNSALFHPGDSILFQGGGTFTGALVFSYATNIPISSATNVITVSSYGTGAAEILSTGTGSYSAAVTLNGVNGIAVTGLTILGGGGTGSPITWIGVRILNGSGFGISNVTVNNCDISNFAGSSFAQTAEVYVGGGSSLDTIKITNNLLHGANGPGSPDSNGIYGIGNGRNITNVTYSGNTVFNIGGVAGNTGGGIVANDVNGGVLEYNIVHDIGGNTTSCGGVAGVWAYASNNITIQYNEVYNVRPITFTAGCDWNAYDLDGGVSNSVVQYNYSHQNAGSALLAFVANLGSETWGHNTFRYNVSENDGLGSGNYASSAIAITGSPQNALEMYGNTIYSGTKNSTNNSSMILSNMGYGIRLSPDSFITNNIFYMLPKAGTQMMYCPYGISGGTIDFNIYYTTGTSSIWRTTTNYTKFADYQVNTGYDLHSFQLNPQLTSPGTGGTLSWTPSLHNGPQPAPNGYRLSSTSSAIDAGLTLSGSSVDYYGNPVPNAGRDNIGAYSAGSTNLPLISSARAQLDFTGVGFNYQATAINSPISFGATGLPSGLSFNSSTGVISGTTALSGTFNVGLSAVNSSGTSTATLVLISRSSPVITSATAITGTNTIRFKYQITASNNPTSYNATNLPAGISVNSSTGLISGTPTATGTTSVTISASNTAGTGSANLVIKVMSLPPPVTYYVSNTGSDSNNGTSTSTPWQTIAKVNSALFHSGDSVLFKGSGTFSGALVFSYATNVPNSTSLYPITVGSYGTGPAEILSTGTGSGSAAVTLNGVNGIAVTGLTILGGGGAGSPITWIGVNITNGSGYGISKVTVNNCDISNFAGTAAANSAEVRLNGSSGLHTINITNNILHGANGPGSLDSNGIYGIGNGQNTTNVTYSGNTVYNLGGVGGNTGGGIVANAVDGGVLEYNIVHDIGGNTTSCGGVAGVWAYDSNNVTIQYNEVYNVQPITFTAGCDWNAYDLDGGVSNSVVQYNYSHHNAGSALLAFVANVGGDTWGYNTFRYNISENDGMGLGNYASSAIAITGSPQSALEMYGNTIYSGTKNSTGNSSMILSNMGHGITLSPDSFITNNIFYMLPQGSGRTTQWMYCPYGISGGTIDYNIYYTPGISSPIWRTTSNYTNFADYQLRSGYDLHSFQLDPQLVSPGTGGTLSWTPSLHNGPRPAPSAYQLSSSSPAIDAGLTLSGSSVDYYGNPAPNAGGENIGAYSAGATSLPVITSNRAATGTVNTAFNYTITASHSPTSYNAANLPAGLSVNISTGVINGAPTGTGTTSVTISAINATGTGTATLTLIVQPLPPVINSALSATGTAGSAFSYTITASNSPTSYNATGLPSGLSVSTSTGAITGTPGTSGTSSVTLSAINAGGTGTATLTLTVLPVPPPPVISSALSATGTAGSAFSYTITASNSPTSYGASGLPAGLSLNASTGAITGTPSASGTSSVTLSATNAGGVGTATLTLTVSAGPISAITVSPAMASVSSGSTQQFSAVAKDSLGNALNPQPAIAWAASGGGTIDGNGLFTAGSSAGGPYTVTATSASVSGTASVSVLPAAPSSLAATWATMLNGWYSLTWADNSNNESGFAIQSLSGTTWTTTATVASNVTSYIRTGLNMPSGPYTLRVIATGSSGNSAGSNQVSFSIPTPPSMPDTLVATAGTSGVNLTWNAVSGASGYTIARSATSGTSGFSTLKANQSAISYLDTTAVSGTTYWYKVFYNVNGVGASLYCSPISVTAGIPLVLTTMTVSPSSASVQTGSNQQFSAVGKDQYGAALAQQPAFSWSVSGGGTFSSSGLFTSGTNAGGPYTVTASSGTVNGTSSVIVVPGALSAIGITPANASVQAGSAQQYSAVAVDGYGNPLSPQPSIAWSVTGGGTINSGGLFTSSTISGGPYTVTATSGSVIGTTSVTVTPGALSAIGITPANASVQAGSTQQYSAVAVDSYGNPLSPQPSIAWSVTGGGAINSSGLFTAGTISGGSYTVTATSGSVSGTTSVTVIPGALSAIGITPANASVQAGSTQQYSAVAVDSYGNPLSPQPSIAWSVTGGGTINSSGLFTSGTISGGPYTVTATSGSVNGTTSVTVIPGALSAIGITPANASVQAAGTQQYSAVAVDSYGNALRPQPTLAWSITGGGTISGSGLFTSGTVAGGPYTVTATSGSVSGTTSVTVVPGALSAIGITPANANVQAGGAQQYSAVAVDIYGNPLSPQPAYAWGVSGGGTIDSSGLFTAGTISGGPYTVTATSGSVSGTTSVSVVGGLPAAPTNLAATWATMLNGWYKLTWTDNSNNETGFTIQILSGTSWTTTASVAAGVTTYQRTGLSMPSGPYTLRVIATGTAGNSAPSNQVTFSIPTAPSMPDTLTATPGTAKVILAWAAVSGASNYSIQRSLTSGSGYNAIKNNLGATSYTDTAVTSGTTYYYKVTYNTGAGASLPCNPVSAVPN